MLLRTLSYSQPQRLVFASSTEATSSTLPDRQVVIPTSFESVQEYKFVLSHALYGEYDSFNLQCTVILSYTELFISIF